MESKVAKAREWMSFSSAPEMTPSTGVFGVLIVVLIVAYFLRRLRRRQNENSAFRRTPKFVTEEGYIRKLMPSGYARLEHRVVAEQVLGRRLQRWEVVHHINGMRTDNRPQNLCVMHRRAHHAYHRWYDWVFKMYGRYPRRETQLRKLRDKFGGTLLADVLSVDFDVG